MLGSRVLSVVLVACATAGCSDDTFECRSDANCQSGGTVGMCQPDGYCSFPDDTCPSGQRYGEFAGAGKAGTCVPVGDPGETGDASTSVATSVATSATGPTSSSGPVDTTMGVEVGPSSSPTASSADATTMPISSESGIEPVTDDGSSSTGRPVGDCSLLDAFEANAIDDTVWDWWEENAVQIEQVDGVLRMTLDPMTSAMGGMRTQLGNIDGYEVELEVGTIPNQMAGTEQTLILADDFGADVRLTLSGADIMMTSWNGMTNAVLYAEPAFVVPGWKFRLTFEDGLLLLEHKDGPGSWTEAWEGASPIDTGDVMLVLRALTFGPTQNPGVAEFDEISACTSH